MGRRPEQKICANDSAHEAGNQQRRQHSHGHLQPVPVGASAGGSARPQGESGGGIGWNRRHAAEQKRGEGEKAASACDRVQGPAQDAGDENENRVLEIQE